MEGKEEQFTWAQGNQGSNSMTRLWMGKGWFLAAKAWTEIPGRPTTPHMLGLGLPLRALTSTFGFSLMVFCKYSDKE